MSEFEVKLSEEQYSELRQFWREFTMLGLTREQEQLDQTGLASVFLEWIDNDGEPCYSLGEILAFFSQKEHRDGTLIDE